MAQMNPADVLRARLAERNRQLGLAQAAGPAQPLAVQGQQPNAAGQGGQAWTEAPPGVKAVPTLIQGCL